MQDFDAAELDALAQRLAFARRLLWVTPRLRSTGALTTPFGFWNGLRTVSIDVKDGRTGAIESRDFYALGEAFRDGEVQFTADITVRTLELGLPAIDAVVEALVRTYDVRNAPMQLYRALLHTETRELLAPAKPRFVGYIDGAPIVTPAQDGDRRSEEPAEVTLKCVSTTRELTRVSAEVRSHDSQMLRHPGDAFYKDTAVCGDWEIPWGQARSAKSGLASGGGS